MKSILIITIAVALFQHSFQLEYGDDYDDTEDQDYQDDAAASNDDSDEEDRSYKVIYDEKDAPTLFRDFVKKYEKKYKNDDDYKKHYENFVKNLKEINRINSDKEVSSTADINVLTDLSKNERRNLLGVVPSLLG